MTHTIHTSSQRAPRKMSRREFLRAAAAAGLGIAGSRLSGSVVPHAKAKSVIQIWMWGGPSHLDTFDPKPDAGYDYRGPYDKAIPTSALGVEMCAGLPLLAERAHLFSILRGMTHGNNGHETASYMVQTGRMPGDGIDYPGAGAVVSYFKGYAGGYKGLIPPYIVMTQLQGRFSESGFLGNASRPFATGGNPGAPRFEVEGVVAKNISGERQIQRKTLLRNLDSFGSLISGVPAYAKSLQSEEEAWELITGDSGKIFDLNTTDRQTREAYGMNKFGQSCLAARRLVEYGVPWITINYEGWDTHKNHFEEMRRKLPELDKGLSSLIDDLSRTGLLDSTIIWWGGEFGRTPRVDWDPPWSGGRSHYGPAFSSMLAGGGFKGGIALGATDARGEEVRDRPVYPWDMISSIYRQMGIDLNAVIPHPRGFDVRITPESALKLPSGGLLDELV